MWPGTQVRFRDSSAEEKGTNGSWGTNGRLLACPGLGLTSAAKALGPGVVAGGKRRATGGGQGRRDQMNRTEVQAQAWWGGPAGAQAEPV